eukprot:Skav223728  [mRNA]  locus=scaffold297:107782:111133:- [translate_table: standard]
MTSSTVATATCSEATVGVADLCDRASSSSMSCRRARSNLGLLDPAAGKPRRPDSFQPAPPFDLKSRKGSRCGDSSTTGSNSRKTSPSAISTR